MTTRNTRFQLKNANNPNQAYPASLLLGEPIVNTADGIMLFSGNTTSTSGWTQSPSGATFFEVGSNLYNLKIRNQITSYSGITNLSGKFLSGTSNGFVLADISSIVLTGGTASGDYLPLSGGTVTGNTTFTSGLSVNYIDFDTTPNVPAPTGGTVYFDSTENALSYKPITPSNDVTVNIGQESLIRIYNNLGVQINNGQALHITGATSGSPTVSLAVGTGGDAVQFQISGIATHDIPNSSYGFMTVFGVVRDINLTGFTVGEQVYLSQTVPGGFSSYSGLSFTGRTCEVGHVIDNSSLGKLQVTILNEIEGTIITTQENNILSANNSSTGIFQFSGLTIDTPSGTTFSVGSVEGWIIDNVTSPANPSIKLIIYSGSSGNTALNVSSATETYILLTSGLTITQQTTFPTPQQRRQNLYLGKFGHGNRQFLINTFNEPDSSLSPVSQLRDMFTSIKLVNDGVIASANGANLNINTSAGVLYGLGIGYITNKLNPNSLTVNGQSPATFQYRTQTGGTASNTTLIDPLNRDVNGVITPITGTKATNQRIFLLQNGQIRVQYGQQEYNQLAAAVAALQNETFVTFPNFRDNGILIGILSVLSTCTQLNDTSKAQFFSVSKFGELIGAAGGASTTTLQQAYNNSGEPEILINSTLDGLSIRNGTGGGDAVTSLIQGQNTAGVTTSFIRADGAFSGTSIYGTGLTATTISATTYQNLPRDVFVSGGTYNSGSTSLTFTNTTGGTFNVTGVRGTYVESGIFYPFSGRGTSSYSYNTGGGFDVTGYTYGISTADGIENTPLYLSLDVSLTTAVRDIQVQSDGKILIGGKTPFLTRLNPDGTKDTIFETNLGANFNDTVRSVRIQSDGKILVGGEFTTFDGNSIPYFIRLNSDGTQDTTFNTNLGSSFNSHVLVIRIQPDGKILVGGNFTLFNGNTVGYFTRLNSDGSLDSSFNSTLSSSFNDIVYAIELEPNGKILIGGNFTGFNGNNIPRLTRLNPDGSEDTAFNTNLGSSFSNVGQPVYSIKIQPDNNILVGGDFKQFDSKNRYGLIRLFSDGTEDAPFYTNSDRFNVVYDIQVQLDGKILVGGEFNDNGKNNIGRLLDTGVNDTIFNNNIGLSSNGPVYVVNIQTNGLIIVGGQFTSFNSIDRDNINYLYNFTQFSYDNPIGNDGSNSGRWRFISGSTSPSNPIGGNFVTDSTTVSSITKISISSYSIVGSNYYSWLNAVKTALQNSYSLQLQLTEVGNNSVVGIFTLSNPVDNTSYFDFDVVTVLTSNGSLSNNKEYTISWSYGITGTGGGPSSGDYLPLSGGTVSGATDFTNGLTANTISATTLTGNTIFSGTSELSTILTPLSNYRASGATFSSFTGTPLSLQVTFSSNFPDTNYSVVITGQDERSFFITSKSISGFTINTGSNTALTGNVDWIAFRYR